MAAIWFLQLRILSFHDEGVTACTNKTAEHELTKIDLTLTDDWVSLSTYLSVGLHWTQDCMNFKKAECFESHKLDNFLILYCCKRLNTQLNSYTLSVVSFLSRNRQVPSQLESPLVQGEATKSQPSSLNNKKTVKPLLEL